MAPTQYPAQGPVSFPPLSGVPVPPVQPPSAPSTLIHRTQKWIEENQRLLILGATLAVVGGAGYLLYNRPPARSAGTGDSEKGSSGGEGSTTSKKNKKKKGKKSGLRGEGEDGPLLEEITKKEEVGKKAEEKKPEVESAPDHLEGEPIYPVINID